MEAVLYRYRARLPWRDLPERFGGWKNTYKRLRRWCESGVFARIFKTLAEDRDNEYVMIDATIVPAHQHSAGARKKGGLPSHRPIARGLTTKIHVIVDALGNSVAMSLTPGQASDLGQAEPLLDEVEPEALLADKAYDANALIDTLAQRGITPVIPSKANRIVQRHTGFALYRERNLVEHFFGKLKAFRAIATRYDKLASTFLAAIQLVSALFWLN